MQNSYKGMTLVELLLYIALFSTIILTMVQFFIFISNKNVDARNRLELSKATIFLREHFAQTERGVSSIVDANSTFNSDNGTLALSTADGNVTYSISNGNIIFNNGSDITLLPSGSIATKLRFTPILDSGNATVGVNVAIILNHVNIVSDPEEFDFLLLEK